MEKKMAIYMYLLKNMFGLGFNEKKFTVEKCYKIRLSDENISLFQISMSRIFQLYHSVQFVVPVNTTEL